MGTTMSESGPVRREKILVEKPKVQQAAPTRESQRTAPKVTEEELRKRIRDLRSKERDSGLTEKEKILLKEHIYDLSQIKISEDSGYREVTDKTRERALNTILEETDPNATVTSESSLDFERELTQENILRIYEAASQILDTRGESRSKGIQERLVKTISKDLLKAPGEVNAWIEAAKNKLKS